MASPVRTRRSLGIGIGIAALTITSYLALTGNACARIRLIRTKAHLGSGRKVCFFEGPDGVCLEVLEMQS